MTTEDQGAYLRLLFFEWKDGPLPTDEKSPAGAAGAGSSHASSPLSMGLLPRMLFFAGGAALAAAAGAGFSGSIMISCINASLYWLSKLITS